MAFPKDLRQRMINLMYLVLMAMLAINIDPAALQGYKTINDGMATSYNAFSIKNDATTETIKVKAAEDGNEKEVEYAALADRLNGVSDDMGAKIEQLIAQIKEEATNTRDEYVLDDKDPADKLMIGTDPKSGEAAAVRTKIDQVLSQYNAIINESPLPDSIKTSLFENLALQQPSDEAALNNDDNTDALEWEEWTFKGKPAIALEAILNQMKNDAKATEGQILDAFAYDMNASKIDIPYDTYSLAVIPSSTYVERGDQFTAKINVGQTSTKMQDLTKVFVNGRQVPINSEGFAVYTETKGLGEHALRDVYAIVTNPQNGETERIDMTDPVNYKVINPTKPSAAVSADAMNVFYAGLDNPISVSASGMGGVTASCAGCSSFSPNSTGGYNAKVTQAQVGKSVDVSVAIDGNTLETKKFRVLRVPDPDVRVGKYKPGAAISTSSLAAQKVLRADLDNFPYDAPFQVLSFDLGMLKANKPPFTASSSGPRMSPAMTNAFQRAGPGWLVVFRNIKVKGPDGTTRDVGSVSYITR